MGLWSFLLFFLFLVLLLCLGSLMWSILSGEPITFLEDLLCCTLFSRGSHSMVCTLKMLMEIPRFTPQTRWFWTILPVLVIVTLWHLCIFGG